ncbi:MAG: ATP-binding protein [Sphingomonadaceae bacterium]
MDDNNSTLTATYFLALNESAISDALACAKLFAEHAKCGENACIKLAIVVEEVIANIVEHGECTPGSSINLSMAQNADQIIITVSDCGTRFDPLSVEASGKMPPQRGGGAGIALIRAWSLAVDWHYSDGRNHLRIVIADHED